MLKILAVVLVLILIGYVILKRVMNGDTMQGLQPMGDGGVSI